jgi:hypothetical protein
LGGRCNQISEFKVSLVYKVSSRTVRATQRNPVFKNQKKKKKKKGKEKEKKIDFQPKVIKKDKEAHFILIKVKSTKMNSQF